MRTKLLSALCATLLSFPLINSAEVPKSQFLRDETDCTRCSTSQHGPIDHYLTQSDRSITQAIRNAIYNDSSLDQAYNQVTISTVKGQVTLNGTVATQREKDKLSQKARETVARNQITNKVVLGDASCTSSNHTCATHQHGPIDHFQTQSDRTITQAIRNAIYNDSSLDNVYNQVTISTVKGHVTLNGNVSSVSEKNSIFNKARESVDSKHIDNDLVVTGASSMTMNHGDSTRQHGPIDHFQTQSDRTITQAIRNAIYNDSSLDDVYNQVPISTVKGHVTLNGHVSSVSEKNSIFDKARESVDSKHIDNQIVVNS